MFGRVAARYPPASDAVSARYPSGASTIWFTAESRPTSVSTLVPQAGVAVSVPTKLSVSV